MEQINKIKLSAYPCHNINIYLGYELETVLNANYIFKKIMNLIILLIMLKTYISHKIIIFNGKI